MAIGLILAVIFITVSRFRFVDGDEGFYILAAKLVYHGKVLYRDFFYTQMPLLPYVYGAWMQLAGETWNSARLLSALAADALGCLLYLHVEWITGRRLAGLLAVVLFTANIYTLAWFPTVKTFALSALFLFAAYLLVWEYSQKAALLFAGVFLGLAIDTRLYLAAVTPVFFFCVHQRHCKSSAPLVPYLWLTAGLGLALSPNLYWLITDPHTYYFNNLGYHALRADAGFIGAFRQKLDVLTWILGIRSSQEGNGFPFGLLIILNLVPFALHRKSPGPRTWPATWIALVIIVVSLLPTPTFHQYFAIALPFLIPGAALLVWDAVQTRSAIAPALALLVLYLLFLPYDLYRYTVTGKGVIGILSPSKAVNWRLDTVLEISRQLQQLSRPGELVLSFWPGYIFQTDAACVPGMENHSALYCSNKLTPGQRRMFHIPSNAGIEAGLARHSPCLVVLGNQESMQVDRAPYEKMLSAHGYRVIRAVGDASIYSCQ